MRYPELTRERPGLLMQRPDLRTTTQAPLAAVALHDRGAASQPAPDMAASQSPVPIEDLVRDYIDARRNSYMDQGWEKFKERQYRAAGDLFGLAASVCLDDPGLRAEVELARMFAALASHQYALAIGSLRWLMTPNRRTGQLPDADFLSKLSQVEARYADKNDFLVQIREYETYANANPKVIELYALRAIILLTRGDRAGANYYAKAIPNDAPLPWSALDELIERSGSVQASPTNASTPSTRPAGPPLTAAPLPQTSATQQ